MNKKISKKIIGIDLGTTNSCIAFFEGGVAKVIKNKLGERTTPSIVSFNPNGTVQVGSIAKRQLLINSDRTIYSVKRHMGTNKVFNILNKEYRAEDISAYILQELKKQAEEFFGHEVKDAIITVPAYFNETQRQSTKDAGTIAGLNVLRLINEPTAASLAYKSDKDIQNKSTILVYDLGGGTFDVSILCIESGIFEVKSTNGDRELGGDDFDNILYEWALKNIKKDLIELETEAKKNNNYNAKDFEVETNPEKRQRIRLETEKVKKELSFQESVAFEIPFLTSSYTFSRQISKALFESLTKHLLLRTKTPIELALTDAGLKVGDIEEIILVGGSTRMPMVTALIKDMFKKDPKISIDPDESVALGSAIEGSVISGENKDIVLMDVTPLSLGISESGSLMAVVIPRNTTIPTTREKIFTNAEDNQPKATISIFQGERKLVADNTLLGEFDIELTPAKRGTLEIKVIFELDANGILNVSAYDGKLNKKNNISITSNRLEEKDIQEKIRIAEEFKQNDLLEEERIRLFSSIEDIRMQIHSFSSETKDLSETENNNITEILNIFNNIFKREDIDLNQMKDVKDKLQEATNKFIELKKEREQKNTTEENNTETKNTTEENNTEINPEA